MNIDKWLESRWSSIEIWWWKRN